MSARPHVLVNALSLTQGGGRTYVVNLLREIDRDPRGFRFTVLTGEGRLSDEEAGSVALRTVRFPGRRSIATTASRVLYEQAVLPIRARKYDLLYCLADIAPFWGRTPSVVALRNLNIYDRRYYDTARLRTLERLARLGVRHARRVIVPSRAAATAIGACLGLDPSGWAVVPHGISPELFPVEGPKVESEVPYLFVPCVPERHKNLAVAIRGLAAFADEPLELWIAGASGIDPHHIFELERLARELDVEGRVRFLGAVPYDRMAAYYRGALAMVFPSFIETFGHPILEAMRLRTPVLAADIPAFRELAGDAALYFQPENPEELARGIRELRKDEAASSRRREAGFARANTFSWKQSVDRLCAVFEEALDEPSDARARASTRSPDAGAPGSERSLR